jgi:hypothetical protein
MNIHEYLKKIYILFLFLGALYRKDIIIFEILMILFLFLGALYFLTTVVYMCVYHYNIIICFLY